MLLGALPAREVIPQCFFRGSTCRIRVEYLTRYSANINSGFSCKLDRLGQLCRCVQTSQQRAVGVARGSLRLAREASADASLGPEKAGKFRRSKKPSGQARERERSELKFRVARKKEPSRLLPCPPLEARRSRAGVLWARQRQRTGTHTKPTLNGHTRDRNADYADSSTDWCAAENPNPNRAPCKTRTLSIN